ncbi:Indoleamine 2,3-dioxygenase [Blyttiomyces helicus]|uniref:Indoleamine 2,3-dioxygenase n=1 Tax=Blyttiomyces helicus TaxID=388810 RepID=A0A4P9W8P8_9FUNG|nr:Indoleamine 2,3-dioxygenase [Blyttiomyces helicus]|eukprot:RKO87458.1 Indoleamine 2,3-dioxygenase [Blyttiomyces helicus]
MSSASLDAAQALLTQPGEVPDFTKYGIDPVHGFLPVNPPPLTRLPAAFEAWEKVLDVLQPLLLAGKLRHAIDQLPLLDVNEFTCLREWQRAYTVLCFLGQGYVWGKPEDPSEVLPMAIAKPWYEVARYLRLKPVISYAAVELFNYRLLDPNGPWDLSNLSVMHVFTGLDEAWFYLISIAIEATGARAIPAITDAMHAVLANEPSVIANSLDVMAAVIDESIALLMRNYEKNDPHIFYHRLRPYLSGWENSAELPRGLFYEGDLPALAAGEPKGTFRKYAGASAGQSSLIHCIDIALGVQHLPTRSAGCTFSGNTAPASSPASAVCPPPTNHIHEMRRYMPGEHRDFVYALERGPSIRNFVLAALARDTRTPEEERMIAAYNHCADRMRAFRDRHLQIVAAYIIVQARRKREMGIGADAQRERAQQSLTARGTGGTDLVPFLKQSRNETAEVLTTHQ